MAQGVVNRPRVFVTNPNHVSSEPLTKAGAENVMVKYLLDERQSSNRFALRVYTVNKGGHTPLDQHAHEHHVYVLSGSGLLRMSEDEKAIRQIGPSDTIFIPSMVVHQFINNSEEPLVFLCEKGNPSLYASDAKSGEENPTDRNYC